MTTVFFERVGPLQYPLFLYHLARGHRIMVLNLTAITGYAFPRWVGRLVARGKVEQVYVVFSPAHGRAMDAAETVIDSMHETRIRKAMRELLGADEADLVFKKILCMEIFKCLHIQHYLGSAMQHDACVTLVPHRYAAIVSLLKEHGSDALASLDHV
ncbi:hypothetical protein ACFLQU_06345, partial [Verrucomicrobiota bacterium]